MSITFSNGLTIRVSSMAQARRFLQSSAQGVKITHVDNKPVNMQAR